MSDNFDKRKTKKDKAKRNKDYYGKYSPKHVRMQETLIEKRQHTVAVENPKDTGNKEKKRGN
jgi:hypothetical protein